MIVLAADVGGTTARVVLYRGSVERGRAEGRGMSMRLGAGAALAERVAELARPLLSRSRASRADALVIGAAGAGRSVEREELRTALEDQRLAWRVLVTTDAELAREAAFEGSPGVLLVAGTGSIAIARDADGALRRAGGLGWRMGDQGSAYWIAARALQAVGAMHDGTGGITRLAEALCAAAGVAGIAGLVRWSTEASVAEVAALAPAVLACADGGDAAAVDVRRNAVEQLVLIAVAAGAGPGVPVALAGGLLASGRPLHDAVAERLRTEHGADVIARSVDPCRGAVVLARREG